MKTKIVTGSCLAVCMLVILPSISAIEYNTVVESNKSLFFEKIQNIDINELRENIKDVDIEDLKDEFKKINTASNGFGTLLFILLKLLAFIVDIFSIFGILPMIFGFIFYIYFLIFWR